MGQKRPFSCSRRPRLLLSFYYCGKESWHFGRALPLVAKSLGAWQLLTLLLTNVRSGHAVVLPCASMYAKETHHIRERDLLVYLHTYHIRERDLLAYLHTYHVRERDLLVYVHTYLHT